MEYSKIKFRNLLLALTGCLILFSCSEDAIFEHEEVLVSDGVVSMDSTLIEGHYIVLVSGEPAVKNSKAASVLEELSKEIGQKRQAKINHIYKNVLSGFSAELTEEQVRKLRKDPRVLSIESDGLIYPTNEINVQEYVTWGIDRIDQRDGPLDRAYVYTSSGAGVTAYIFDSGIRYSHQEFGERATLGYDFVLEEDPDNTDPNQGPGEDCMGHGTHVAGTVGGKLMGVAKNVNLVSLRVFGCTGATPRSRYVAALDWVTANAVHPAVVNMSLGFSDDPENQTATELAIVNSMDAGIHFVVSAGNFNGDSCGFSPARVPGVLTVGASDIYNKKAYFSSYGECVDLYAPGTNIASASIQDDTSYRELNGTSMSAPHVTGLVALYLENFPMATPVEVHAAIVDNTTQNAVSEVPSGTNNLAYSLWGPVEFMPPVPEAIILKGKSYKEQGRQKIDLSWNITDANHVDLYRNGQLIIPGLYNHGEQTITGDRGQDGHYTFQVCEVGYDNCSEVITVIFGDGDGSGGDTNEPPKADFKYTTNLLQVQFTDASTDVDGSVTSWSWDFGDGNSSSTQHPSHTYLNSGSYSVVLTVTDDAGDTGSNSKNISVTAEEPAPDDIILTGEGYKVKGRWNADLVWSPSGTSAMADIYRDGNLIATVENTGSFTDVTNFNGSGSLSYKICEAGTTTCSNEISMQF